MEDAGAGPAPATRLLIKTYMEDDIIKVCKHHGLTNHRVMPGRLRCRKCATAAVTKRRRKLKQELVAHFGGACVVCGYNKCISALQFHHKDPSEKDFGIAIYGSRSLAGAIVEAEKCILICANCHTELHSVVA